MWLLSENQRLHERWLTLCTQQLYYVYIEIFLYRPIIFLYIFISIYIAASSSIRSILSYLPKSRAELGACRCHVCGLARKQHHMLKASSCQWFKTCDDFKKRGEILLQVQGWISAASNHPFSGAFAALLVSGRVFPFFSNCWVVLFFPNSCQGYGMISFHIMG